jgi:hypothetical protein
VHTLYRASGRGTSYGAMQVITIERIVSIRNNSMTLQVLFSVAGVAVVTSDGAIRRRVRRQTWGGPLSRIFPTVFLVNKNETFCHPPVGASPLSRIFRERVFGVSKTKTKISPIFCHPPVGSKR